MNRASVSSGRASHRLMTEQMSGYMGNGNGDHMGKFMFFYYLMIIKSSN